MRFLCAVVLLASASAASEPTVEEIIEIIRKREEATKSFAVRIAIEHSSGGRVFAAASPTLDYVREGEVQLTRSERHVSHPLRGTILRDRIELIRGAWSMRLERDPGAPDDAWTGRLAGQRGRHFDTIENFGLDVYGRPLSERLHPDRAWVEGRTRVGSFDCLVVLFDRFDFDELTAPTRVWLSIDHDYFPVRMVDYKPTGTPTTGGFVHTDGRGFDMRSELAVDGLVRVGGGWLPTAARSEYDGNVRTLRLLSHGPVPPDAFELADVASARVSGMVPKGDRFAPKHPAFTGAQLRDYILHGAPLIRNDPPWKWMILGGGVLVVVAGFFFFRRRPRPEAPR
ncbi:MAG: hypothetical protein AAGD14_04020 [Planctomycetota bacterium]